MPKSRLPLHAEVRGTNVAEAGARVRTPVHSREQLHGEGAPPRDLDLAPRFRAVDDPNFMMDMLVRHGVSLWRNEVWLGDVC